jgi:hypothetical protein
VCCCQGTRVHCYQFGWPQRCCQQQHLLLLQLASCLLLVRQQQNSPGPWQQPTPAAMLWLCHLQLWLHKLLPLLLLLLLCCHQHPSLHP